MQPLLDTIPVTNVGMVRSHLGRPTGPKNGSLAEIIVFSVGVLLVGR